MQSQHFNKLQLLLQYLARYRRCDIYPKFTKWRFSRQYRYRFAIWHDRRGKLSPTRDDSYLPREHVRV